MLAAILFLGFKGVAIVAAAALLGGGYLGYTYGASVEKKAAAALSQAGTAASSASKQV